MSDNEKLEALLKKINDFNKNNETFIVQMREEIQKLIASNFPKYFTGDWSDTFYVRFDNDKGYGVCFNKDGTQNNSWSIYSTRMGSWKEITKEQAEALVKGNYPRYFAPVTANWGNDLYLVMESKNVAYYVIRDGKTRGSLYRMEKVESDLKNSYLKEITKEQADKMLRDALEEEKFPKYYLGIGHNDNVGYFRIDDSFSRGHWVEKTGKTFESMCTLSDLNRGSDMWREISEKEAQNRLYKY